MGRLWRVGIGVFALAVGACTVGGDAVPSGVREPTLPAVEVKAAAGCDAVTGECQEPNAPAPTAGPEKAVDACAGHEPHGATSDLPVDVAVQNGVAGTYTLKVSGPTGPLTATAVLTDGKLSFVVHITQHGHYDFVLDDPNSASLALPVTSFDVTAQPVACGPGDVVLPPVPAAPAAVAVQQPFSIVGPISLTAPAAASGGHEGLPLVPLVGGLVVLGLGAFTLTRRDGSIATVVTDIIAADPVVPDPKRQPKAPEMQAAPGTYDGNDKIRGGPGVFVRSRFSDAAPVPVPAGHTYVPDDGMAPLAGDLIRPDDPRDPKTVPYTPPLGGGFHP